MLHHVFIQIILLSRIVRIKENCLPCALSCAMLVIRCISIILVKITYLF